MLQARFRRVKDQTVPGVGKLRLNVFGKLYCGRRGTRKYCHVESKLDTALHQVVNFVLVRWLKCTVIARAGAETMIGSEGQMMNEGRPDRI